MNPFEEEGECEVAPLLPPGLLPSTAFTGVLRALLAPSCEALLEDVEARLPLRDLSSSELRVGGEDSSMLLQVESMKDFVAERGMRSLGRPRTGYSSADKMPHSLAMAHAVVLLSPGQWHSTISNLASIQDSSLDSELPVESICCPLFGSGCKVPRRMPIAF